MTRRCLVVAALAVAAIARSAAAAPPDAVTILRDRWGVPHIFTSGARAAERGAYANGYAQAQDRLFQMDVLRRAATGRLAELLGVDYVLMDQVSRRDGLLPEELERAFGRLARRDRRSIEAYRDGVNAFIEKVTLDPRLLPFEFFGVPPAPWAVTDSIAIGVLEFHVFGASGGQEVLNADLLLDLLDRFPEAEAHGVFDDLHWIDEPAAPTTIRAADVRARKDPDRVQRFAPAQLDLVRTHPASIRRAAASLRAEAGLLGGLGRRLGVSVGVHRHASNAILVGPALSASGKPILLGGPQTGLNTPSFFWEVGLHGGGYDGEGVIAPAGPGILIGRGRRFATTITSGILDNVDTFVEFVDPADPNRYLFRDRSLPFERRTEVFHVDGMPDVTVDMLRTMHGPVFFLDREAGLAYSRQAAFEGKEIDSATALIHVGFARDLKDFRRLADRVAVSLNLHYADDAGNIAYFHRGLRPLRPRDTDPRLPLDGRGGMEWRGVVQPERLPSVVNPARGFITNWNNKPMPGWPAGEQRELWGVVDRVQVFIDALEAAQREDRKVSYDDVKQLMRHAATSDIFAARIFPFLNDAVGGLDAADPRVRAVGEIGSWIDSGASLAAVDLAGRGRVIPYPGAAIYTAFRTAAQTAVFADDLGSAFNGMSYPAVNEGDQEDDHGSLGSPDALFLRALFAAGPVTGAPVPSGLLPVSRDYFADASTGTPHARRDVLLGALAAALDALTAQFGTADQSEWLLPELTETYRDLGAVGLIFGPTVQERENRGSFNVVAELGSPIVSEIIMPPGESGTFTLADRTSEPPHLRDQLRPYERFEYRRLAFTEGELEAPLTMETIPYSRAP
ncbi:MAG TPA: penicillin acylase family protein [Candidatus Binatia bacterium]|nr:penicillin acylase family protein [Candidatus Binatia bacterium]